MYWTVTKNTIKILQEQKASDRALVSASCRMRRRKTKQLRDNQKGICRYTGIIKPALIYTEPLLPHH